MDNRPRWLRAYKGDIFSATYIHSRIEFGILDGRYWEYDPRYLERREKFNYSDD
jgi:hypothetical protein